MLQPERRTTSFRFHPSPSTGQSTHPSSGCDRRRRGTCLNVNETRGEEQTLILLCQYWHRIRKTVTNSSGFPMLNAGSEQKQSGFVGEFCCTELRMEMDTRVPAPQISAWKPRWGTEAKESISPPYSHLLSLLKFAIWKFLITCTAKHSGWK